MVICFSSNTEEGTARKTKNDSRSGAESAEIRVLGFSLGGLCASAREFLGFFSACSAFLRVHSLTPWLFNCVDGLYIAHALTPPASAAWQKAQGPS